MKPIKYKDVEMFILEHKPTERQIHEIHNYARVNKCKCRVQWSTHAVGKYHVDITEDTNVDGLILYLKRVAH